MGNPRTDGSIGAMKGQPCAVLVERSGTNGNNRGAEDIDTVLVGRVTIMPKESIKGSTDIGPVADSNNTLIAEPQLLAACVQLGIIVFVVVFKIALAQIEDVAHIRCDTAHWQP
jgi:hypothetical protein